MTSKGVSLDDFSIEQLQAAIEGKRKSRLTELREKQAELSEALRRIDAELAIVGGQRPRRGRPPKSASAAPMTPAENPATSGPAAAPRRGRPPGRPGRRPGQGPSMGSKVLELLTAEGTEVLSMTEMTEKLKGYTSSDRPSIIVSQALIRLKKDNLVESAGRGLYRATAGGKKRVSDAR